MSEPQAKIAAMQRKNISLMGDDAALVDRIKISVEKRLKQKVSDAFILRLALRELECIEFSANSSSTKA